MVFSNDYISVLTIFCSYAIFHPLAYLVKLNIEMIMSNLIKKIALAGYGYKKPSTENEFGISPLPAPKSSSSPKHHGFLGLVFPMPRNNEIRKTEEYLVQSAPKSAAHLLLYQKCETCWRCWGMKIIDCINKKRRTSVDHVSVLHSPNFGNKGEARTLSVGTEDEVLAKPEPALKH